MSKVKFVLNPKGVSELLKSEEMMNLCKSVAEQIAQRAGDGYEVSTYTGKTRVNASVRAVTREAMQDNYENNTLLKLTGG